MKVYFAPKVEEVANCFAPHEVYWSACQFDNAPDVEVFQCESMYEYLALQNAGMYADVRVLMGRCSPPPEFGKPTEIPKGYNAVSMHVNGGLLGGNCLDFWYVCALVREGLIFNVPATIDESGGIEKCLTNEEGSSDTSSEHFAFADSIVQAHWHLIPAGWCLHDLCKYRSLPLPSGYSSGYMYNCSFGKPLYKHVLSNYLMHPRKRRLLTPYERALLLGLPFIPTEAGEQHLWLSVPSYLLKWVLNACYYATTNAWQADSGSLKYADDGWELMKTFNGIKQISIVGK